MKYLSIFFVLCYPAWCSLQTTISKIEIYRLLRQADSVLLKSPSDALLYTDIALQSKLIKNDCTLKGTALNLKSRALRNTGRSGDAIKILDQSIPLYRKCKNDTVLATGLATLALCLMDSLGSDTSTEVLDPLDEAARLAQRIGDTMLLSKIYIYFAKNWGDNEQADKALDYNLRCESLLKNSTDSQQIYLRGMNRVGMGNQHLALYYKNDSTDHLERAANSFSGALDDFKGMTHKEALGAVADAKNGLGGAKLYADDIPGAQENFEESLEIFRSLNDTVQAANALYNLSILAESQNDFLSAWKTNCSSAKSPSSGRR